MENLSQTKKREEKEGDENKPAKRRREDKEMALRAKTEENKTKPDG